MRTSLALLTAALMALTFPANAGTGTDGLGGPGNTAEPGSSGTSSGNYNGSGGVNAPCTACGDSLPEIGTGKDRNNTTTAANTNSGSAHTGGRNG